MAWDVTAWENLPNNIVSDLGNTKSKIEEHIVYTNNKDLESVDFSEIFQSLGGGSGGMAKII